MIKLNDKHLRIFKTLDRIFTSNDSTIRLVGGAVRDLMEGKEPKDLDFATDSLPEKAARMLRRERIDVHPTGLKHGTITAVIGGVPVEITTLRVDVKSDGRHAEVEFTEDWLKDAERRDLTFNSMYMDLDGTVYDFFNGRVDLEAGNLKFVGDTRARIREDYLRILRYFRFASHIEKLSWDYDTLNIIKEEVEGLKGISGERIWSELLRILSGKNVYNVIYSMDIYGILSAIGLPHRLEYKTYWEFLSLTEIETPISPLLFIASLLRNVDDLEAVKTRWKFDNNSYKILHYLISKREAGLHIGENDVQPMLHRGEDPNLMFMYAQYKRNWSVVAMLEEIRKNPLPKFPVRGGDLKDIGIEPADRGTMLNTLKEYWITSGYKLTKEELLAKAV